MSEPTIYDLLIAGGGPAGTAAAFRARELGLNAAIVEYDDLLKRIRDYSKAKLILPSFGGGDQTAFPKGDKMIGSLVFQPIDKDELCLRWKNLHKTYQVPSFLRTELTALNQGPEHLEVVCWDHQARCERTMLTRHLVLALGNGVPRRFDIPGNTDGINFRLDEAGRYVGRPSCVIGGGTSAAEAVIAISQAKAEAEDPTAVYWSYRGDRLPRVSKALAESFFSAYAGNGNIRYLPHSEPTAIVQADNHQEYLSIRCDRREISGRPIETTHFEFPKQDCVACIGEDLPEALLHRLGVPLVFGGTRARKRVAVNKYLESRVSGVFMIGDLLSQVYLRAEDFSADPAEFQEIRHRGNIKTALRDGVFVAEVIAQRLAGKTDIQVTIGDLPEPETPAQGNAAHWQQPAPEPGPKLARILPNQMVEQEYPLVLDGPTRLGRSNCHINFPHDPSLAEHHATIKNKDGRLILQAASPQTDIFLVIPAAKKVTLKAGNLLRLGRQFLLVCGGPGNWSFEHYNQEGHNVGCYGVPAKVRILGRDSPDINLDTRDMSLSRRHLAMAERNGKLCIKDLSSANHSFLRLAGAVYLSLGDRFQIGGALLEVTPSFGVKLSSEPEAPQAVPTKQARAGVNEPKPAKQARAGVNEPKPAKQAISAPAKGGPSITFQGIGKTVPVTDGQTICEVAEAYGFAIKAECHMGICGSDPIRILAGHEHLHGPAGENERETLEDICNLSGDNCRLACMARVKGPVTVEIVGGG